MTDVDFVERLVRFGRGLQSGGLEVGPGRLRDAVFALTAVDPTARDDVYWALRCTLCSHRDHLEVFDGAFDAFWRGDLGSAAAPTRLKIDPATDDDADSESGTSVHARALEPGRSDGSAEDSSEQGQGASGMERLMTLDFREYGPQELRDARHLVERIATALPRRRSYRLEPATSARRLDMRRTLHHAMRTEGESLQRVWLRNRIVPRRTVFLLDISGSMSPYARPIIMFAQAAVRAGGAVEAFTFGTRLTRITDQLAGRNRDRALAEAARSVPDWAGGTRIGASLQAFNDTSRRTGLARGSVVIIVSDGWERGEPTQLRTAMAQLHRSAHAVVWVNPLAGDPRYEPLAAGMAAALAHVDVFLPGHNLAALMSLAGALEVLPTRRGHVRRRRRPAPVPVRQ